MASIRVTKGDTVRFRCIFTHQGAAYSGAKLYAAIGKKGTTFNEISSMLGQATVQNIGYDAYPQDYEAYVNVLISADIGGFGNPEPGFYEAYVKLINIPGSDIFWYGTINDIELYSSQNAVFSNLVVTYSKL